MKKKFPVFMLVGFMFLGLNLAKGETKDPFDFEVKEGKVLNLNSEQSEIALIILYPGHAGQTTSDKICGVELRASHLSPNFFDGFESPTYTTPMPIKVFGKNRHIARIAMDPRFYDGYVGFVALRTKNGKSFKEAIAASGNALGRLIALPLKCSEI